MKRFVATVIASCVLAASAHAAPVDAAAITKTLDAVVADAAKLKSYCAMAQKFVDIGDDDKKAEAAGEEIDGYFETLGADFEAAWDAGQNSDEASPEGKAFDEAMTKLEAACAPTP